MWATAECLGRIRRNTMVGRRLLIVDDERMILDTLQTIFRQHGYSVEAVESVAEALQAISSEKFDVLLADLNVGQPGDGFTVVSALRRTQPDAIALILTGYPAFDSALQAIREQVDDFLVKPIHPVELLQKVETTVRKHAKHVPFPSQRVSDIVRTEREAILQTLLQWLHKAAEESGRSLSDDELLDHLPGVIDELCRSVDEGNVAQAGHAMDCAEEHGKLRSRQGFDLLFLCNESTAIRHAILNVIHHNFMLLNMSYLFLDLTLMSDSLDDQWKVSLQSYLRGARKAA